MTSVLIGIAACCAVGLNMAAAVVHQTLPPPNAKPPVQAPAKPTEAEVSLTGCLVQGSAANVFLLQDAKRDPQSATEKPARYVVAPATEDLFLKVHLNHQVRILGVPDGRPQPTPQAGRTIDEKEIPTLRAKGLTMVSASCGGGGGGDWSDADGASGGAGGPRRAGGGSIGLGAAGGGFFGSGALASTGGSAGARSAHAGLGLYGGIGSARTSSVTGAFKLSAAAFGADQDLAFDEELDWTGPAASHLFEDPGPHFAELGPLSAGPGPLPTTVAGPTNAIAQVAAGGAADAPSQALEALMDVVARTTAKELLGESLSAGGLTTAPAAIEPNIVNPEPGTLVLIASGLLLVMNAGRRRHRTARP